MRSLPLVAAAACGAHAPSTAPRAGAMPGWLAIAPALHDDDALPSWIPVDRATVVVPATDPPVSFGARLLAVPLEGAALEVRHAGRATIAYGCDGGALEVDRFDGDRRLPPGPVWLLPAPAPAGWAPAGVPVAAASVTVERRAWTAGRLSVSLERRDPTHADLLVNDGARRLFVEHAGKHYMEGADPGPIDLSLPRQIGMPVPAAAFSVAPAGPTLLVLSTSGYEGSRLHAVLVDDAGGAALPDPTFDVGLYFCAF